MAVSKTPKANFVHFTSLEEIGAQTLFEKRLTNSDMSGQGRLVVPKVSEVVEKPALLITSPLVHVQQYSLCCPCSNLQFPQCTDLEVLQAQAHLLPPFKDTDCVNITCHDGLGNKHTLRWRFWINQASRMYILESLQHFYVSYSPDGALCFLNLLQIRVCMPMAAAACMLLLNVW
jgi:hypothetical protein